MTEVRTAGLNIMMSMKEQGKPVSFVEDCAVPLEHLADYTARLSRDFRKTRHARHLVRPCRRRLPACAPGAQPAARQGRARHARHRRGSLRHGARLQGLAFRRARRRHRALGIPRTNVRPRTRARLRGGEGPVRSRTTCSIPEKSCGRRNSTTAICCATAPIITPSEMTSALDWSAYTGAGGGFQGAVEMCNNNGACRALAGGVMCPSYRVTRDERDVTRGRANTLRLAITGQLGPRRAHLRRDGGDTKTLRLLQGVPPRMPDRRRHGAHEDRSFTRTERKVRTVAARPARRLPAALRALCGAAALVVQSARYRCPARRDCRRRSPASARAEVYRSGGRIIFETKSPSRPGLSRPSKPERERTSRGGSGSEGRA